MTLNRLVLSNYMIHKGFSADFSGNLIALTGEMGHGKSTFVGAIQFCLTGEHPPWTRADLLSWGTSEGSAKLYFTHEGKECSVMRKLHCTEATLKIGDETVTGIRNVETVMTERLGVDKDILKQIGFVQQYEIQSILFDEPGKREKSFQKLLGIGDANKIWTELGTIIQGYTDTENFDASIESLRQMVKRLDEELAAVDGILETSRKAMKLLPSREELQSRMDTLTKTQTRLTALERARAAMAELNALTVDLRALRSAFQLEKSERLKELGCTPEEMEEALKRLLLGHGTALAALNNMKKLAGASESDGTCPLCGASVEEGQIAAHTDSELKRLAAEEQSARKLYEDTNAEFTQIKTRLQELDRNMSSIDAKLSSCATSISSAKEHEKWALEGFAELGIAPEEMDVEKLKASVAKELAACSTDSSDVAELNSKVSMLQGEKNAKLQQLGQVKEMLDAKVKEKELAAPRAEKLEVLSRVRSWFHNSNGPRTMSLGALKAMTRYVNEYLTELHSEIEVMPDNQGLSFAYEYKDGRPISDPPPSTAKLSGGQKIELALAFRLAIYRYFGQKMGIMVLDEPTAHLSPDGIKHFGTLLRTVSTLARNMNLQIIMPTHEKEILPFMDSEIHFD